MHSRRFSRVLRFTPSTPPGVPPARPLACLPMELYWQRAVEAKSCTRTSAIVDGKLQAPQIRKKTPMLFFLFFASLLGLEVISAATTRPIIGVLSTPLLDGEDCITFGSRVTAPRSLSGGSCFHSVYVKWLESAGARVAPIPYDLPTPRLLELARQLNGLLFTGARRRHPIRSLAAS